jgi:uncharacterized protein (DUF362 family)
MLGVSPFERLVAIASSERSDYGLLNKPIAAPEMASGWAGTVAHQAIRDLFLTWRLDESRIGSDRWNPLGTFINPGSTVLLKPNWVRHWNQSGEGLDCLLTHTSVIEAVLEYVALASPGSVIIGDAPLQSCDFESLRTECRLGEMVKRFRDRGLELDVQDFRRTVLHGDDLGARRSEEVSGVENYVLFDLKEQSLLEPITGDRNKFRVTAYNPDRLQKTHTFGRHQYLIARACIDADTVLNLPKLKCHKKAGITGALKNVVGINGNKEFLPHHRKGSVGDGGDCYFERLWLKSCAEDLLDAANRRTPGSVQRVLARSAEAAIRVAVRCGSDANLEGSWYGNDTVWRMTLDLQRILHYGRSDGSLADTTQRHVISITDAIVAGEGEGPVAPTPTPAGFVTGATNAAAAEWVHARLMGFDPERIPLVKQAFGEFAYPLAKFDPANIRARLVNGEKAASELYPLTGRAFRPPSGWVNHCELEMKQ